MLEMVEFFPPKNSGFFGDLEFLVARQRSKFEIFTSVFCDQFCH